MSGTYTFGDTPTASTRLAVLATAFAPSTRALLALVADGRPVRRALDLGCGPGHTTRLLAERFPHATVTGLDASATFVAEARRAARGSRTAFEVRDVTHLAAGDTGDVVFARFLLSHLPDVARPLGSWLDATHPGGHLVVEESEWIDGPDAVVDYLDLAATRIERAGGQLFVGPAVSNAAPPDRVVVDRVHHHPVPAPVAATMFRMNLAVWGGEVVDDGSVSAVDVDRLDRALAGVGTAGGHVEWGLRQLVVEAPSDMTLGGGGVGETPGVVGGRRPR